MEERWKPIPRFPGYSVSSEGRIRNDNTERILVPNENQSGLLFIGLMRNGKQFHRSIPKLVATSFVPHKFGPFDTPINLDGNRRNNRAENLVWRPRWFAVFYHQQFRHPYENPIERPIQNMDTGEVFPDSFSAAVHYGLLEKELVLSILNRTPAWPIYQKFIVVE